MKIGDKIKFLRKASDLTQAELGEKLGVKTNAVSKWECGRVEDIPMSKIKAMSLLFNVPPSYLIDDEVQVFMPSQEEALVLKAFRILNDEDQKAILSAMNALAKARGK